MKRLVNKLAIVAVLALATTVASHAQSTSTIEYGRSILHFDPSFTGGIASLGAQLGGVGFSNLDSAGNIVFPVVNGAVDLQTSQGEVNHLGGISVIANGLQLRLQNFVIDTTGAPVMTAILVVNNKFYGRIPLFNLTPPPGTSLPLPTTLGVLQLNGFVVTFNATGAATINKVFGNNAIPAGMLVGSLNLYAIISPNSAS